MYIKTEFDLKNKKCLSRELYKTDFYEYSPTSLAKININNNNLDINVSHEDSYISLQNSYFSVEFEVTHNVNASTQNAVNNKFCVANLDPIALFSAAILSKSSNKHLEKFANLHAVSLLHKFYHYVLIQKTCFMDLVVI